MGACAPPRDLWGHSLLKFPAPQPLPAVCSWGLALRNPTPVGGRGPKAARGLPPPGPPAICDLLCLSPVKGVTWSPGLGRAQDSVSRDHTSSSFLPREPHRHPAAPDPLHVPGCGAEAWGHAQHQGQRASPSEVDAECSFLPSALLPAPCPCPPPAHFADRETEAPPRVPATQSHPALAPWVPPRAWREGECCEGRGSHQMAVIPRQQGLDTCPASSHPPCGPAGISAHLCLQGAFPTVEAGPPAPGVGGWRGAGSPPPPHSRQISPAQAQSELSLRAAKGRPGDRLDARAPFLDPLGAGDAQVFGAGGLGWGGGGEESENRVLLRGQDGGTPEEGARVMRGPRAPRGQGQP